MRIAMIEITTSNSISVKPRVRVRRSCMGTSKLEKDYKPATRQVRIILVDTAPRGGTIRIWFSSEFLHARNFGGRSANGNRHRRRVGFDSPSDRRAPGG